MTGLGWLAAETGGLWRRRPCGTLLVVVTALLATGALATLAHAGWTLERALLAARGRVTLVVELTREPTPADVPALLGRVRALGDVAGVTFVTSAEALERLGRVVPDAARAAAHVPGNPLPATLLISPATESPERAAALVARLQALPEAAMVLGPAGWAERLSAWRRLWRLAGWWLVAPMAGAAALAVGLASAALAAARREEVRVLVAHGARGSAARAPSALAAALAAALGAGAALALVAGGARLAGPTLGSFGQAALGADLVLAMPPSGVVAVAVPALLAGLVGGWCGGARRR